MRMIEGKGQATSHVDTGIDLRATLLSEVTSNTIKCEKECRELQGKVEDSDDYLRAQGVESQHYAPNERQQIINITSPVESDGESSKWFPLQDFMKIIVDETQLGREHRLSHIPNVLYRFDGARGMMHTQTEGPTFTDNIYTKEEVMFELARLGNTGKRFKRRNIDDELIGKIIPWDYNGETHPNQIWLQFHLPSSSDTEKGDDVIAFVISWE